MSLTQNCQKITQKLVQIVYSGELFFYIRPVRSNVLQKIVACVCINGCVSEQKDNKEEKKYRNRINKWLMLINTSVVEEPVHKAHEPFFS